MRTHRVFPALQPWSSNAELLRELVRPDYLIAARIEPVSRRREPSAVVDLHFSDGERSVTVPFVYVDLAQLDVRELDPLVFPHDILTAVPDTQAAGVVERLVPELERRVLGRGIWEEDVIVFGDDALFAVARARGFFGAARLATSVPRVAPALYARRFAVGKHVVAYGPDGIELAAFLRGVATSCSVIGDPDADAARWYGTFATADAAGTYELAIGSGPAPVGAAYSIRVDADARGSGHEVPVAVPVPADLTLSFDPIDSPAAAYFSIVSAREPFMREAAPIVTAPPLGGSAGRIAIVMRPDAAELPDADTVEAQALAAGLRAEGFTAELFTSADALDGFGADLVHVFGVYPGGFAKRIAEWTARNGRPLVVHAFFETPSRGGFWGAMVAPYCFGYSEDDRSVALYLEMLARRAVEVDNVGPGRPWAPPGMGQGDAERVLAVADVVLVNSEREREAVDAFRPGKPTFVVAPLAVDAPACAAAGPLVGSDPFVLVHAPIGPDHNQLMLARAAAAVGVPFVFAGPIADPVYAERVREFAPANVVLIPEPDPAVIATLYRSAGVVADAAWVARGHARLVTAAALGAAIVCSQTRWVDLPDVARWSVDPADVNSIARGIGEAWDGILRRDEAVAASAEFARRRLATACPAIVASYAKIAQGI